MVARTDSKNAGETLWKWADLQNSENSGMTKQRCNCKFSPNTPTHQSDASNSKTNHWTR
jgi:hypothetical protein